MTTAPATPPAPAKAKTGSGYIVLTKAATADVEDRWKVVSTVQAKSVEAAVRAVCCSGSGVDGTYVAVPTRSWKPVKVTAKTETKLIVEDV